MDQTDEYGTTCADCGAPITDARPSAGETPAGPVHEGCGDPDADDECPSCTSDVRAERWYVPGSTGMPVSCADEWHDDGPDEGPPVVTLADGTRLGEVDPAGTPVQWRESGTNRWRDAVVLRLTDRLPGVVVEWRFQDRVPVTREVAPQYVRRAVPS